MVRYDSTKFSVRNEKLTQGTDEISKQKTFFRLIDIGKRTIFFVFYFLYKNYFFYKTHILSLEIICLA